MLAARDWFGDASVFVVDVPLACCALESQAAAEGRFTVDAAAIPAGSEVVVAVSGTITEPVVPALRGVVEQLPGAKVIAFGACACIGGPYWDSYSVVRGAGEVVHVDRFIAGCPPPPSAIDDYLREVRGDRLA